MFVIEDSLLKNLDIDKDLRDELVEKWEFGVAYYDTYEEAEATKAMLEQGRTDSRFSIKECDSEHEVN